MRDPQPDTAPPWRIVRRDQCNGRTLSCVNCDAPLDGTHYFLCHAAAKAREEAKRV